MTIKDIFNEISDTSGNNAKMGILFKYKDNELLRKVLYLIKSKRVKFFIRQIPEYSTPITPINTLEEGIDQLSVLSDRKVSGNDAVNLLQSILSNLSSDDAYIIERIIDKDPKIGLGSTFINKIIPDLIEKTPYQGAKPFSESLARKLFTGGPVRSDIKMDGRYANAIIYGGVDLISRQGETTYVGDALFLKELAMFDDCVLNGELTIDGEPNRYIANGIVASIVDIEGKREKRSEKETNKKIKAFEDKHGDYNDKISKIKYTVWDMITVDEYFNKKSSVPYEKRRAKLVDILNKLDLKMVSIVESKLVYTYDEAMGHFQEVINRGDEGTIIKSVKGTWKDGKPNWQIKLKIEINLDLKIVGFNYGTKGSKNEFLISSLNVESSDGILKTSPAGINEEMMKYITENQDNLINTIVEVKCCGLSQNSNGEYSLLHPVFKLLRDDKNEGNSLEECININKAALGLL